MAFSQPCEQGLGGEGWKPIGVVDRHVWQPPFGYHDDGYAGFVPYPGTKPYTA